MADFPVIPFSRTKVVTRCSLLPTIVMAWDQTDHIKQTGDLGQVASISKHPDPVLKA